MEQYKNQALRRYLDIQKYDLPSGQLLDDMVLWLHANHVVVSGSNVTQATDMTNRGNNFVQTVEANRPIYEATGWPDNDGACWRTVNNEDFLTIPTNSDLAVTDESWLCAMSVDIIALSSFETYFGNGHSVNADQGYRCFLSNTGAMAVYASSDAASAMSAFSTLIISPETRRVLVWGVDGPSGGDVILAANGSAIERKDNIRGYPIPDGGLNITCGGGHGQVSYIPSSRVRQVGFWKRPSTESFTNDEINQIINYFAEDAGL